MKNLNIKTATKRYNSIMNDLCYEHNTIGERLSENTENWNLRDMVAECDYVLGTFYEDGHANNDGQYPDYWEITAEDILDKRRYDRLVKHNDEEKKLHQEWLSMTRRLRNFIKAYKPFINDMECAEGHCSQYD